MYLKIFKLLQFFVKFISPNHNFLKLFSKCFQNFLKISPLSGYLDTYLDHLPIDSLSPHLYCPIGWLDLGV